MRCLPLVLGGMVLLYSGLPALAEGPYGGTLSAGAPAAERFYSPSGRFEVSFAPPLHDVPRDPDRRGAYAGATVRRYVVSFFQRGYSTPAANTEFIDVLASAEALPTPLKELAAQILWSPNEDFVLLPREHWERAPAAMVAASKPSGLQRQAVSLNTSFPWQTTVVPFEDAPLIWADPRRLAGNILAPCRMSVGLFDAREGKTSAIMQGSTPDGYQIIDQAPGKIHIRKVLDSCASEKERAAFHAECVTLDLSFMRREIGACPP